MVKGLPFWTRGRDRELEEWRSDGLSAGEIALVMDVSREAICTRIEQLRRKHGVAIPSALAVLDPDQHALAVDVVDL